MLSGDIGVSLVSPFGIKSVSFVQGLSEKTSLSPPL